MKSDPAMKKVLLDRVVVHFKNVEALKGVTVAVEAGQVLLLVGPNGAGKSTLMQVLLGIIRPDAGTVQVDGATLATSSARAIHAFREHVGYLPEAVAFSDNLTGLQVLRFFANARGIPRARIDAVLERVGLTHAARRAVRGYSRGMKQRLGLGVAILAEPALLIMDEPTGGLDQEGLDVLWSVLDEWREAGRLVVMASHDLTLLERRVDRIGVLRRGELIASGTPGQLRDTAGLPVRVVFDCTDERAGLLAALSGWDIVANDSRGVIVEVVPADLLALMRAGLGHQDVVRSVRVDEPGLDRVYDRLVGRSAA